MGRINLAKGSSVYIDANTLIYQVEDVEGIGRVLQPIFEQVDRGELIAVTSELTLGEVLVKPIRDGNETLRAVYERALIPRSRLITVPISREILRYAARLRSSTSLKLPDAIHAATALLHPCTVFLTNDLRIASVPGLPVLLLADLR